MDGTDWAASAMVAARTRLDIAAGNLANVSTGGFRRNDAHGFLTATGARVIATPSHEHGALRHTGRDLDLAIVGDGAFRMRAPDGRVELSRDGAFVRQSDGTLQDGRGRTLLGARGPLHVAENAAPGEGAIALPRGSSLRSGFLETANVNAIGELIDVMTAQRSFESAQKVASAIDGTRQKSADVARVR
jgi:flagellar hook-basal body protein